MNHLKQKIDNALYSYQPNEFMPIFMDGRLANRRQFYTYKAQKAVGRIIQLLPAA